MRYYLLTPLEGIRSPEIADYNKVINYKAFMENKPYNMKIRTICPFMNDADLGNVLLTPFPLFSETVKSSLELFLWDCAYREIIFLDQREGGKSYFYFLPFFHRIAGEVGRPGWNGKETEDGVVYLEEQFPEDLPAIYLVSKKYISVILRLDLAESLIRNGLCGVRLRPVAISERRESYG